MQISCCFLIYPVSHSRKNISLKIRARSRRSCAAHNNEAPEMLLSSSQFTGLFTFDFRYSWKLSPRRKNSPKIQRVNLCKLSLLPQTNNYQHENLKIQQNSSSVHLPSNSVNAGATSGHSIVVFVHLEFRFGFDFATAILVRQELQN